MGTLWASGEGRGTRSEEWGARTKRTARGGGDKERGPGQRRRRSATALTPAPAQHRPTAQLDNRQHSNDQRDDRRQLSKCSTGGGILPWRVVGGGSLRRGKISPPVAVGAVFGAEPRTGQFRAGPMGCRAGPGVGAEAGSSRGRQTWDGRWPNQFQYATTVSAVTPPFAMCTFQNVGFLFSVKAL